jgi:hypothetical protein
LDTGRAGQPRQQRHEGLLGFELIEAAPRRIAESLSVIVN